MHGKYRFLFFTLSDFFLIEPCCDMHKFEGKDHRMVATSFTVKKLLDLSLKFKFFSLLRIQGLVVNITDYS